VECARLIGVHIQSARNRETEINIPKDEQKAKILSLRKLGAREVREMLEGQVKRAFSNAVTAP
jgi:hypothetical protein